MAATWTKHRIEGFDYETAADVPKGFFSGTAGTQVSTANTRYNYGNGAKGISLTDSPGNYSTVRLAMALKCNLGGDETIFTGSEGGNSQFFIKLKTDGSLQAFRGPGSGTSLGSSAAGVFSANTWLWVVILVSVNDTTGSVIIFVSNTDTPVLTLTSQDTKATSNAYASSFTIAGSSTVEWDDVHLSYGSGTPVAADALPDSRIVTPFALVQGDYSDFTPDTGTNHVDRVRDAPSTYADGDSTYLYDINAGDKESMLTDDLPVDVDEINFVQNTAMVRKNDASARTGTLFTRRNGNDTMGSAENIADTYKFFHFCQDVDPETGVAWVAADVDDTQVGFELTS